MVCLPSITTAALFVAIILIDLYNRDWNRVPGHGLFGAFAVLLMGFICDKSSESVAWILLVAPFALVFLGYFIRRVFYSDPVIPSLPTSNGCGCTLPCPCCATNPCHCLRPCPKPKPCPVSPPKPKNKACLPASLAPDA